MTAPRLFVVMASHAPVAVIIARGPSRWTHLSLWDTETELVTSGAWFKGRLYESKCDLSPDGALFLYAAFKGGRAQTPFTDSWTAISRPPWLYALALWPVGTTYGGGGRFVGPRQVSLRGVGAPHPDFPPRGLEWTSSHPALHASGDHVEGADWSGRDQRDRVAFARDGQLFVRDRTKDRLVHDFRGQKPSPLEAPAWARAPIASTRHRARQPASQK
jgi:hypothetical protein